jgi:hypothetical protein
MSDSRENPRGAGRTTLSEPLSSVPITPRSGITPREFAADVMRGSQFVRIVPARAESVAREVKGQPLSIPNWDLSGVYLTSGEIEEVSKYFLVLNALNYCFFRMVGGPDGRDPTGRTEAVRFSDGQTSGATLAAKRITEYWTDLRNPEYLSQVTGESLATEVFNAPVPIPFVEDRAASLREVGLFLQSLARDGLTLTDFLSARDGDAFAIASAIPGQMPGWSDPFLKRAQLFVGMLFGRYSGLPNNPITEASLCNLTVFADYRLPQTLIAMGIIEVSNSLATALERGELIPSGSRRELELRAATILGADALTAEISALHPDQQINALQIDFLLWRLARTSVKGTDTSNAFVRPRPEHHRTLTTQY